MTTRQLQSALRRIGWPIAVDGVNGAQTKQAVRDFQRGYAFANLKVSGHAGTRTKAAIVRSVCLGGKCSKHFYFRTFASHGNGWIRLHRSLALGLEKYHARVNGNVGYISGYRDPAYNKRIGGASMSQHLYGNASDIFDEKLSVSQVRALHAFSGIGYVAATGLVRHVDVRHAGPNFTGGSPSNPTIWAYA